MWGRYNCLHFLGWVSKFSRLVQGHSWQLINSWDVKAYDICIVLYYPAWWIFIDLVMHCHRSFSSLSIGYFLNIVRGHIAFWNMFIDYVFSPMVVRSIPWPYIALCHEEVLSLYFSSSCWCYFHVGCFCFMKVIACEECPCLLEHRSENQYDVPTDGSVMWMPVVPIDRWGILGCNLLSFSLIVCLSTCK